MIIAEQKQSKQPKDRLALIISILAIIAGALKSATETPTWTYILTGLATLLLITILRHDIQNRYDHWVEIRKQNRVARSAQDELERLISKFFELSDLGHTDTVTYALREVLRYREYAAEKVATPPGIPRPQWDAILAELREHRLKKTIPVDLLSPWRERLRARMAEASKGYTEILLLLGEFLTLVAEYTRHMVQEPIETINKYRLDDIDPHHRDHIRQNLSIAREGYVHFLDELEGFLDRTSRKSGGVLPKRTFSRPPTISV